MTTIKKGQYIVLNPDTVSQGDKGSEKDKKEAGSSPSEIDTPPEDVETPEFNPNGKKGPQYERTLDGKTGKSKKEYKSKESLGKGGNKQKIADFWTRALSSAMSSSSNKLSEKAKQLLKEIGSNKPKVNWKRELKKFVDQAFNQYEVSIPNRRFLGSGDVLYGRKRSGKDTLKRLVLPVDTSGSISKTQIKVFFEEVWHLATKMDIDETIIIYCSDQIDNIDIVKRGKKPDLSKYASTGGNNGGFDHPFLWMQQNKVTPSAVIYLTDSFATYPAVTKYGINKYKQKVFWFICNATANFDKPPFGKYIHVPMDSQGNFL